MSSLACASAWASLMPPTIATRHARVCAYAVDLKVLSGSQGTEGPKTRKNSLFMKIFQGVGCCFDPKKEVGIMSHLLNKKNMAASIGISVQAFDQWGVTPTEKRGREVFYDVRSVLENRIAHEMRKQQPGGDIEDGENEGRDIRLQNARIRLTEAQAYAQELKNLKDEKLVVDTEFCSFALSRLANDISAILDSIPLSMQRRFVDMDEAQLNYLKVSIAKAMNAAVMAGEKIPGALDEYLERTAQ